MAQKLTHCSECGSRLEHVVWNSSVDVVHCDNTDCELFHRPIAVEKTTVAAEYTPIPGKQRGRKKKKAGSIMFVGSQGVEEVDYGQSPAIETLQRLREDLLSQKE